jgi:hypothetical protein
VTNGLAALNLQGLLLEIGSHTKGDEMLYSKMDLGETGFEPMNSN